MSAEYHDRSFGERANIWFGQVRNVGSAIGEGIVSREEPGVAADRTSRRVISIIVGRSVDDFYDGNQNRYVGNTFLGPFREASLAADDAIEAVSRVIAGVITGVAVDLAVQGLNSFVHMGRRIRGTE